MMEIMIALVVISIGLVGLYSLQVLAIDGNITAQEMTQATSLGTRWTETLRREAITWTDGDAELPVLLRTHGAWLNPDGKSGDGEMVSKDFLSEDGAPSSDGLDLRYCLKYRVDTVPSGQPDPNPSKLRVVVRVLWPRRDRALGRFLACPDSMMDGDQLKDTWQITIPTLVYRHAGDV